MIRLVIYVKGICCIRMSSFIVTPYRMRRPSTQTRMGGSQQVLPQVIPQVIPVTSRDVRVDAMTELQNTISGLKHDIDGVKLTISGVETLRREMSSYSGMEKTIRQYDMQSRQIKRKIESLRSEIAPERGVSRRVTSIEAKLVYATNQFETYKDEYNKSYEILNTKLSAIDDKIACHPSLQMLSSRIDTIESRIDRLMHTLSGLSQIPVIQKRVTGSRTIADEEKSIRFGSIHRISSH